MYSHYFVHNVMEYVWSYYVLYIYNYMLVLVISSHITETHYCRPVSIHTYRTQQKQSHSATTINSVIYMHVVTYKGQDLL